MEFNLPSKVRFAIYLITGVGSIVVSYLAVKGTIGDAEVAGWAALSAFANTVAALNTTTKLGER